MIKSKNANLFQLTPAVVGFSLLSIIFITLYVLNYSVIFDYGIYNMQELTVDLEAQGTVITGLSNITETYAVQYREMPLYLDYLWLSSYILLFFGSIIWAYTTRRTNYFGFLSFLFYGTMLILFVVSIFINLTNWWKLNILDTLLPNTIVDLPMFYWWLENAGVNILVLLGLCALVNIVDFNFSLFKNRKKKEEIAFNEDEI